MLDVYTNLSKPYRQYSGVFDTNNPRKIIFKSKDIGDCYRYILEREPENKAIKKQYEYYMR